MGHRNPVPTVDLVIQSLAEDSSPRIVLVKRRNPPLGWALPGGFIDYGESVEEAAVREAREETGLEVRLLKLLSVYSRPDRDPRQHTISIVFVAQASGRPRPGDDAEEALLFSRDNLPTPLCFDHDQIISDYFHWLDSHSQPASV